jgi:hypothetical protein
MKHSTSKRRGYGMLLVAFLLILSACSSSKSDADLPPPPAGPAALLVAHPWEMDEYLAVPFLVEYRAVE